MRERSHGHFRIDSFFEERQFSHLDILDSDIQGFEVEMLPDGMETFRKHKIDYVFISTHSQNGDDFVWSTLQKGYRIEVAT